MFRTIMAIGAICLSFTVAVSTCIAEVAQSQAGHFYHVHLPYWDEDPRYEDPRYFEPAPPRRFYRPRSFGYRLGPPVYQGVSPAPIYGYELRPIAPPLPPAPSNCGEYHYWNGSYCADARREPPYVGPRW